MKYAVVKIGGSQYKVEEGQTLLVDKLALKEGETVEFKDVLLVVDDGVVKIGQPNVPQAKIDAKVVAQEKGEKIRVARYKAKSRYRKVKGFRAAITKIIIEKIATTEALKKSETRKVSKQKKIQRTPKTA